ncbi:hypothetical protein [Streptomyces pratensis]|uniref:hypothetical protein n=1 Tax=Streptomyces pratensis TaxID=1169025 RepID=UPI00363F46D7
MELLRRVAYDRAVALGLAPDQARLLADAVLGGVIVGWDVGAPRDDGQSPSSDRREDGPS